MRQIISQPDVRLLALRRPYRFESPFEGQAYALMLVVRDPSLSDGQRNELADAIVESGCRYACCAGFDCSGWDDAIDWAFLASDPDFDPPDDRFVMTTWHEQESLREALWFFFNCTSIDGSYPQRFLILLLDADVQEEAEVVAATREQFGAVDRSR